MIDKENWIKLKIRIEEAEQNGQIVRYKIFYQRFVI